MPIDEELKDVIYAKLGSLGVNVEVVKKLNLSLFDLEEFCLRITDLVGMSSEWCKHDN